MNVIDIGVFAHNEEGQIGRILLDLLKQDLFTNPNEEVRIHVLANGCSDGTVAEAINFSTSHGSMLNVVVHDFREAGKSRTWNRFVHNVSRPEANILVFLDADIEIPCSNTLRELVYFLSASRNLSGASSRPVKDIVHDPSKCSGSLDNLIAAAGGTLGDWKSAICGEFYLLKADVARSFYVPVGLPVEDGFVRAMVQTKNFNTEGQPEDRLDGRDELFHVYTSERRVRELIQHQTRIVIGSAINTVIFERLRSLPEAERTKELREGASDAEWLSRLIRRSLPRYPFGYVPVHFLIKRVQVWVRSPRRFSSKRVAVTMVGLMFDTIVYVKAQFMMWRGIGAGYW